VSASAKACSAVAAAAEDQPCDDGVAARRGDLLRELRLGLADRGGDAGVERAVRHRRQLALADLVQALAELLLDVLQQDAAFDAGALLALRFR
jgi:hypothetical protein